jgi:hypothetical protein
MKMGTYKQIQNWILRNYGFTVKPCWIAHVKEICGLNPRRASNRISKTKRLNPCPQNKIKPIQQALKHFGLI